MKNGGSGPAGDHRPVRTKRRTAYGREWRAKHPTTIWFAQYKATLSCNCCGERSPVCLEIHHSDLSEKKGAVANMVRDKRPVTEVQAEIAKCVVVCLNCHAKLHAGMISAETGEKWDAVR